MKEVNAKALFHQKLRWQCPYDRDTENESDLDEDDDYGYDYDDDYDDDENYNEDEDDDDDQNIDLNDNFEGNTSDSGKSTDNDVVDEESDSL